MQATDQEATLKTTKCKKERKMNGSQFFQLELLSRGMNYFTKLCVKNTQPFKVPMI